MINQYSLSFKNNGEERGGEGLKRESGLTNVLALRKAGACKRGVGWDGFSEDLGERGY